MLISDIVSVPPGGCGILPEPVRHHQLAMSARPTHAAHCTRCATPAVSQVFAHGAAPQHGGHLHPVIDSNAARARPVLRQPASRTQIRFALGSPELPSRRNHVGVPRRCRETRTHQRPHPRTGCGRGVLTTRHHGRRGRGAGFCPRCADENSLGSTGRPRRETNGVSLRAVRGRRGAGSALPEQVQHAHGHLRQVRDEQRARSEDEQERHHVTIELRQRLPEP